MKGTVVAVEEVDSLDKWLASNELGAFEVEEGISKAVCAEADTPKVSKKFQWSGAKR
jgi:hypothetical protein